ncbi:FG-GAP-like repeat-containing protein [Leptospira sarikeiensis]|nr:FG-GAP-like repeat-containing protein [Leptospira sarikeiensis]
MNLAFEAILEAQIACLMVGNTCVDAATIPIGDVTPPSIAITSLPTNGLPNIETGFIFGAAGDDTALASVEVSLDGGAYTTATGTTSWSFALPNGSSTWRLGSHHTINIRCLDTSGNISNIISLNVRKGRNKDINGDGYGDLVVLAPGDSSGAGMAYVYFGGPSGITAVDTTGANQAIQGQQRMGYAAAVGDVNGDGYGDIAIGASDYSSLQGVVYVFHGSAGGFSTSNATSADRVLNYTGSNEFGYVVALGDVNGDGYDDLATGAYRVSGFSGLAFIYYSTGSGGISGTAGTTISGPGGSNFACGMALGDVNGDGFSDFIVGGNAYSGSAGAIWVFHSSGTAGVTNSSYTTANSIVVGESMSNFGIRVFTADVNGDEYFDVAVGAPQYSSFLGRTYVFNSTGTTSGITVNSATLATTIVSSSVSSSLGLGLSMGDVDNDGFDDLVSGAPSYSSGQGRVFLNRSNGTQVSSTPLAIIVGESGGDSFGNGVTVVDINGDSRGDLVAGAVGYPAGTAEGRAYYFHSGGSGVFSATNAGSADRIIDGLTSSEFGSMLVLAEDPEKSYLKFFGSKDIFLLEPYRLKI